MQKQRIYYFLNTKHQINTEISLSSAPNIEMPIVLDPIAANNPITYLPQF